MASRLQPSHARYEAALRRAVGLADFERSTHSPGNADFHIERMSLMLDRLGDPHLGTPTVHVAGTDGKGSTAAMVTSMLTAAGYKAGLYTSPHLHSAVERIRVGLEPVSRDEFADLVDLAWPAVEWVRLKGNCGDVSFFELLTAMAFLHFKQIGADFQVVEVGLGGRLDATNVVRPDVCAITRISLDHVSILGDTLPLIAREKAGIIKRGVPVVVAPQPQDALEVFRQVASEREAPLVQVDDELRWRQGHVDLGGQSFEMSGLNGKYSLRTPLLGDHQLENAATAIAAVETLGRRGFGVPADAVVRGLSEVRWPGRLQVLPADGKQLVVDGAHNPASAKRLVEAVRRYFEARRVFLIFGALGGHSARGMLAELSALAPDVAAVRSRQPRSAPVELLAKTARGQGVPVFLQSEDVGAATRRVLDIAGKEDLVLATGSLSVAAEVIEEVGGIEPELYPYLERPAATAGVL